MSTPGIGDPYWYEWFVGLKYVLRIYYGGASGQFEDFLLRVSVDEGKPTSALLARAMKVTCDPNYIPEGHILDSVRPIKHVYDEACFVSVLQAFLLGCANREKDEAALLDLLSKVCSELEGKGSEKEQLDRKSVV